MEIGRLAGADGMRIVVSQRDAFEVFMTLRRETAGRSDWERTILARPHRGGVARFAAALAQLPARHAAQLERHVAASPSLEHLVASTRQVPAAAAVVRELAAEAGAVRSALAAAGPGLRESLGGSWAALERSQEACLGFLRDALGVVGGDLTAEVIGVPATPRETPCEILLPPGSPMGFVNYTRLRGPALLESILVVAARAVTAAGRQRGTRSAGQQVAARLDGDEPGRRRMADLIDSTIINVTSAQAIRNFADARHLDLSEPLGIDLTRSGLADAVRPFWLRYLAGELSRGEALAAIADALAGREQAAFAPRDAARLAADFYLLELLSAGGDPRARDRLAELEEGLARDFTRYLQAAVGTELGHSQLVSPDTLPDARVAAFVAAVNVGESALAWRAIYERLGPPALELAEAVFDGPSVPYGGRKWAPVARVFRCFLAGEISRRVFIDQCFTLRHNNGPLFDKCFDTSRLLALLDAQAAGDIPRLLAAASAEVRRLWQRDQSRRLAGHSPAWLGRQQDAAP